MSTINRQTEVIEAAGTGDQRSTQMGYDANGSLVLRVSPLQRSEQWHYDDLGRAVRHFDGQGKRTETRYDPVGNAVVRIDELGQRTTSTFDNRNRVVAVEDPLHQVHHTSYDAVSTITLNWFSRHLGEGVKRSSKEQIQECQGSQSTAPGKKMK